MVYSNEFVRSGSYMEVRLFLVNEERVRYPDVLDELGADGERLDAGPLAEGESRIRPELAEVEVQRKVLGT